jgi:chemotaxis protein CheD
MDNAAKNKVIVGVSDARISTDLNDILVTYSVGTSVSVSFYDEMLHAGALFHFQFPNSHFDAEKAKCRPFIFADTGFAVVREKLAELGVDRKYLKVRLVGGASTQADSDADNVGRSNHLAIRKILWMNGILITAEHMGGNIIRNMSLDIANGDVTIWQDSTEKHNLNGKNNEYCCGKNTSFDYR